MKTIFTHRQVNFFSKIGYCLRLYIPTGILFFAFIGVLINDSLAQTAVLDAYIREGLQNNQALKQQRFLLEKNLYALREANTLFLPTLNFNTTYTSATGGRRISLPVGDLVNPVYQTLNQLTQSDRFPQISNVDEQLMPRDFYDAKFRVAVPLVNTEIYYEVV